MLEEGQGLGGHRLVAELGPHGGGALWLAEDPHGAQVLLHVTRLRGRSAHAMQSRLRAAQARLGRAPHPNVARVLGVGVEEPYTWVALEWVDGLSLRALLERARASGPWPSPYQAAQIVREAARAVAHLEALPTPDGGPGALGRELTPDELMVARDGGVVFTAPVWPEDGQEIRDTAGPKQSGSLAYAGPEVLEQPGGDARTDVYSLGAVLWELLTGQPPFLRTSGLDTLTAARSGQLPGLPAGVPGELGRVVTRCLERNPEDRFPAADALVQALDVVLADQPEARPSALARLVEALLTPTAGPLRGTAELDPLDRGLVDITGRTETSPTLAPGRSPRPARTPPVDDPFFDPVRDVHPLRHPRFEVLGKLGEGAMGEVYKVRDLELDEVVALKRIPRSLGSEANLERLRREVRLARRIASAHVCRIFDIVDLGEGERGLTMEVIDGMTLAEHLEAGLSVDYQRFARWGAQVADGLAAAHQLNIVHRDLKPENIMIRRADDQALLLDFGIARPPDDAPVDTRLTQAGMIMGTPLYMSPEQLANAPLDARSDLYSLGLILAELITGQVPHQGRTYHEILHLRVRLTDPYLLRDVDPGAPAGLADVVDHLLKQAPADRPDDAEQVKLQLRAWLEGRPSTPPAPAPAEAPREAAMTSADAATVAVRSERPWWVAIALLIVVVAGLVASLVNQGPRPRTGSPDPGRQAAERLPVVDAGASPEVPTPLPAPDAGFSADAGAQKVWIPPAEEM